MSTNGEVCTILEFVSSTNEDVRSTILEFLSVNLFLWKGDVHIWLICV